MRPHAVVAPGPWTLVHAAGLVVLLADTAPAGLVDGCRSAAASGDLDDVLDAALAEGVRAVPDLAAVALSDGGARVVVRGGARVVVEAEDGTRHLVEAAGARPWRDVDLADAVMVAVLAPAQDVESAEPLEAPVVADRAVAAPVQAAWPLPPSLTTPSPTAPSPTAPSPSAPAEPQPDEVPAAPPADDAPAFSYDFLFGATERGLALGGAPSPAADQPTSAGSDVHDRAREGDRDHARQASSAAAPPLPRPVDTAAVDLTLPPPSADLPDDRPAPGPGVHDHAQDVGRDHARQASTAAAPPPLISSVPWRRADADEEPAPAAPVPTAAPVPVPVHQVSLPARPQPEPAPAAPTPQQVVAPEAPDAADVPDELDELDEATVDRAALLAQRPVTGPEVLAVLCPAGHPSPAHATTCRVCGRDVPAQTPYRTPRPPLGVLTLSTGDVVTLDRGVLLGRAPTLAGNASLGERPHVVKVASPDKDISRNHAQFALEGWHVLVSDLGSTNGTTVQLPGQEPVRLRPGDQQSIEPGTVVVLADEVSLVYEVTP